MFSWRILFFLGFLIASFENTFPLLPIPNCELWLLQQIQIGIAVETLVAHLSGYIYNPPPPVHLGSNKSYLALEQDSLRRFQSQTRLPVFSPQAHNLLQQFVTVGLTHSMYFLHYHNYQCFSAMQSPFTSFFTMLSNLKIEWPHLKSSTLPLNLE